MNPKHRPPLRSPSAAATVKERIDELGRQSDEADRLTRLFGGPAMSRTAERVTAWMVESGLEVRRDVIGNVIGRRNGASSGTFVVGSHIDTVPNAGRYDGVLGVLIGIAVAHRLRDVGLPCALEVVAFVDEEGARFGSSYLASRAYRDGLLTADDLSLVDRDGVALSTALESTAGAGLPASTACPDDILGYLEVHIEQGPTLEWRGLPLGVVTKIAGQAVGTICFRGEPGHAGANPMAGRRDALCAASELITWMEDFARNGNGLRATVGALRVEPSARNVIPGLAEMSVDIRCADATGLREALCQLTGEAARIAEKRNVGVQQDVSITQHPVDCDPTFSAALAVAARRIGEEPSLLESGAGHDAAIIADRAPVAMLFVRCRGGVSHHPAEEVSGEDISAAIACATEFVTHVAGLLEGRRPGPCPDGA